ncbi:hypothetical protein V3M78_06650 [Trueperella pyogenes]|uniref:hypothetical protein n=1 Tax=Trueperella pyogenes TaxID=1661 RepID=UPI00345D3C4C
MATKRLRAGAVTSAAKDGDKRAALEAMRDRIALTIDDRTTSARDLAALTKRLREIMDDIEEIDAAQDEEAVIVENIDDVAFDPSTV